MNAMFGTPIASPESAAASIEAAEKLLADAKARADAIAEANAASGDEPPVIPATKKITVMAGGMLRQIDGRNRTYAEYFVGMASRFIGSVDKFGVKIPGDIDSGDLAISRYARDMLCLMAIASGARNQEMPGEVIAINPADLQ